MKKTLAAISAILILVLSFCYATTSVSNASMNIEAYKSADDVPTGGTFEIGVELYTTVNGNSVWKKISGLNETSDISNFSIYGDYFKAFRLYVKTNYGNKFTFSFKFTPFINQKDNSKTLSAMYKLETEAVQKGWVRTNQSLFDWTAWNYYFYYFKSTFDKNSESLTVDSDSLLQVVYSIDAKRSTSSTYTDANIDTTYTPGSDVLYGINYTSNGYMDGYINGYVQVSRESYDSIVPNVDYKSTVTILVEVQ